MIPYDPPMIASLLRSMPVDRLQMVRPADFQRWPAAKITKAKIIGEMIAAEKSRRSK